MLQDVRVLFFLVVLVTAREKLTVIMVRRSVFFPVRYPTIESDWPLCVMWRFVYVPACISLILDIRPPARPGVPPSWCAGGDEQKCRHFDILKKHENMKKACFLAIA